MNQHTKTPYWHVRKVDVFRDSALVAGPPFASFDVVLRRDYDALVARVEELEAALRQIQLVAADLVGNADERARLLAIGRAACAALSVSAAEEDTQ